MNNIAPRMGISELIKNTQYLVEATSLEMLYWYMMYSESKTPWKQYQIGTLIEAGVFGGEPVVFSLDWDEVDGRLICSYDPTSNVVDYKMIEAKLGEMFPGIGKTNAMNFHHALR